MDTQGSLTFNVIDNGTRMCWSWDLKPRGVFSLITPLIRIMGKRQEERIWGNLKHYLENQEARPE